MAFYRPVTSPVSLLSPESKKPSMYSSYFNYNYTYPAAQQTTTTVSTGYVPPSNVPQSSFATMARQSWQVSTPVPQQSSYQMPPQIHMHTVNQAISSYVPYVPYQPVVPSHDTPTTNVAPVVPSYSIQDFTGVILGGIKGPKDVELRAWQEKWAERSCEILRSEYMYIDTSLPGRGKSFIVLNAAKKWGLALFIMCPKIMVNIWKALAFEYGVRVEFIMSYGKGRSRVGAQPKHGYLNRNDNAPGKSKTTFTATQKLFTAISRGVLFVCDEFQKINHENHQHKAVAAITEAIIRTSSHSRIALLSGTPITDDKQLVTVMKMTRFITASKLYQVNPNTGTVVLLGLQELVNRCNKYDPITTAQIMNREMPNKANSVNICCDLYEYVLKRAISGAISAPTNMMASLDAKNGFYNIDAESCIYLRQSIDELTKITGFDANTGQVHITMRPHDIGLFTQTLVKREAAKTRSMARVVRADLMRNGKCKVICTLNYTRENLNALLYWLGDLNPMVMAGDTSDKKRDEMIHKFNNDPNCRLLIGHPEVIGVGISLQDLIGDSERTIYMSPTYMILWILQMMYRIHRDGVKSVARMRIFYAKDDGRQEARILNGMAMRESLEKKTDSMKRMLDDETIRSMIFPADFPSEYEP